MTMMETINIINFPAWLELRVAPERRCVPLVPAATAKSKPKSLKSNKRRKSFKQEHVVRSFGLQLQANVKYSKYRMLDIRPRRAGCKICLNKLSEESMGPMRAPVSRVVLYNAASASRRRPVTNAMRGIGCSSCCWAIAQSNRRRTIDNDEWII